MDDLQPGIVGIRANSGTHKFAGTGFAVQGGWVITCAHVVEQAGPDAKDNVNIQFEGNSDFQLAHVEQISHHLDIAILKPSTPLSDEYALPLLEAAHSRTHTFSAFGYPQQGDYVGLHGVGKILGVVTDRYHRRALQFDSTHVTHGYSGCPIWDDEQHAVVGMVSHGFNFGLDESLGSVGFAIPCEVLKEFFPPLKVKHIAPWWEPWRYPALAFALVCLWLFPLQGWPFFHQIPVWVTVGRQLINVHRLVAVGDTLIAGALNVEMCQQVGDKGLWYWDAGVNDWKPSAVNSDLCFSITSLNLPNPQATTSILDLQVAPDNPERVYALTQNYLLLSEDRGRNFTAVITGIAPYSDTQGAMFRFAISQTQPELEFYVIGAKDVNQDYTPGLWLFRHNQWTRLDRRPPVTKTTEAPEEPCSILHGDLKATSLFATPEGLLIGVDNRSNFSTEALWRIKVAETITCELVLSSSGTVLGLWQVTPMRYVVLQHERNPGVPIRALSEVQPGTELSSDWTLVPPPFYSQAMPIDVRDVWLTSIITQTRQTYTWAAIQHTQVSYGMGPSAQRLADVPVFACVVDLCAFDWAALPTDAYPRLLVFQPNLFNFDASISQLFRYTLAPWWHLLLPLAQ
jgi:hypothetical protein